jgi:tetratricopeptide (TPR) repeat protein
MLKMGEVEQAIALLEVNARDHADSADSAFGVGRAYATAEERDRAREWLERAIALDPEHRRAKEMLGSLR